MIEAKIIKDSLAPSGIRLTTFVLTYPRFIHAEFMTHRMFSRNASSSRAIPVKKSIKMVKENPAMPLAFKANKAGMQAGESFGPIKQWLCRIVWRGACYSAVFFATLMEELNIHKQYANRILEPFSHITVVVSATEFANFFALRYHGMAQPEICELARQMWELYKTNVPQNLEEGQWHLPFIDEVLTSKETDSGFKNETKNEEGWSAEISFGYEFDDVPVQRSVARCARVSYLNHEGKEPTLEEDLALYSRLLGQVPIHASPAEHQAMAIGDPGETSGNFRGWVQFRKTLDNENIEKFEGPSDD